ncbi:MAG: AAA family ATPase [Gaiellales bacterium]
MVASVGTWVSLAKKRRRRSVLPAHAAQDPATYGHHTTTRDLIGRQQELAKSERVLESLSRGPAALIVHGEPGIGKTAVVDEIRARAAARGFRVLYCSPGEHDARLALAGLGDLLSSVEPNEIDTLSPPQQRALRAALLIAEATGPADARAVAVAVRELLAHLASRRPVLLVVDDLQWLDAPSAELIEFTFRRAAGLQLGLVASTRQARGAPLRPDLGRLVEDTAEVELGPLSLAGLFRLLAVRGGLELPRPQLIRLHEACGGNPLHALIVARELREGRLRVVPGEPVPLPDSLLALVGARLSRLAPDAREVLATAAALSRPAVDVLEAVFDRQVVDTALEAAAAAGIADLDHHLVRFAHPLFGAASYSSFEAHVRRRIHRRLAVAVDDPEEQARHLALGSTRRDSAAAAALERAAERAANRGSPTTSAELIDLALELTPTPDKAAATARTIRAVQLHVVAGDTSRARSLGVELHAALPPGPERARVALALAPALEDDLERMTSLVGRALEEPGLDERDRARLLGQLAEVLFRRGQAHDALEPVRRGLVYARATGDLRTILPLVAHLATVEFWSGAETPDPQLDREGKGPLRDWVDAEREADLGLPAADSPRVVLGTRLVHLGAMTESWSLLDEALADAIAHGDERSHARVLWQLAQHADYAGDWRRAEELVAEASELEAQLGVESGAVFFARAGLAATAGRVEEAERLVAEGVTRMRAAGDAPHELLLTGVLGFLRFSQGDAAAAVVVLLPIVQRALELSEPRINRYWPDTIEALAAIGDFGEAERIWGLYAAEAERLHMPRSLARVAHCRGVLSSAQGRSDEALGAFAAALSIHARCPNVFEHGRTLLALGVARRRARRRASAREAIEGAIAIFDELPAPLWAARARAELARTGVRRRAGEGLTETELAVAELAATGLTNREIGLKAHLSPKSVEDVLRRVYRQLGVRNKTELAALTREQPLDAAG